MKKLLSAEVIGKSFKLGLGTDIWYSIDYLDMDGTARHTVIVGKDIEEACQKKGIDWLGGASRIKEGKGG